MLPEDEVMRLNMMKMVMILEYEQKTGLQSLPHRFYIEFFTSQF